MGMVLNDQNELLRSQLEQSQSQTEALSIILQAMDRPLSMTAPAAAPGTPSSKLLPKLSSSVTQDALKYMATDPLLVESQVSLHYQYEMSEGIGLHEAEARLQTRKSEYPHD
ncbi:uncharacterized protein ACLA_044350 [Aspergillus clavatus NRRL 1]|uniref:Uncharacterized protein n=1 Tax=Aspergillus clavatus (strain ATCC 1007 / CBS 513.65 / DSM 816 / NCTC 3887 / NRRL 1 / QM 1276 / 107) TaxID=344612 RepID=A1C8S8_ASPCL|nr:uncharacterized protein ACLA_044350 [Aspergillus clavatus NRRL 1]EAW13715.1 hypothetical protein ACLA_044350 [Aspergillus clavatus NRRL 1]